MINKKLTVGILAHVDAGKTTLSEGILYLTGMIRKLGRVDHQDAFFDTYELERSRGITIFSKQTQFPLGDYQITLLDTPGHVDFSPETERTLQILDYAILVISAADGVTGQVRTLWKLLKRYDIPVVLFVNKMDQPGMDAGLIIKELKQELDDRCIDCTGLAEHLSDDSDLQEEFAMCQEILMEQYLEGEAITLAQVRSLVSEKLAFPCFFGSALKMQGIEEFLKGMETLLEPKPYGDAFGARVYKISRDSQGNRLTWMKITGGVLKAKTVLEGMDWSEKADQLRLYSGDHFKPIQEAEAGTVCAVTGLTKTKAGEGLGAEEGPTQELIDPVLNYSVILEEGEDRTKALHQFRILEEEEPALHVKYNEAQGEISVQVMGQVQMEILKHLMMERFGLKVKFGEGSIVYKETIRSAVEGVGHFEPLRHYAEVHLLLEPGAPGSGLVFGTECREDDLDKNWQRLILTHLEEKQHKGVLTGSDITDMKITLLGGRAHVKHTEGGDFRQATYRAVRQGLMMAESVLLEPVYEIRMELPQDCLGRAMTDLQRMGATFSISENTGVLAVLMGSVPAAAFRNYQEEVTGYTRGAGKVYFSFKGYEPCGNAEEVILERNYDPDFDLDNPSSSVFCSHGAGTIVPWEFVRDFMHVHTGWEPLHVYWYDEEEVSGFEMSDVKEIKTEKEDFKTASRRYDVAQMELEDIFNRTFNANKRPEERGRRAGTPGWKRKPKVSSSEDYQKKANHKPKTYLDEKEYLLVDGYNIIFAWDELKALAKDNIDAARDRLMDIMANYQGSRGCTLILVFDAYKVRGGTGSVMQYHNIYVVYTKEAETADQYIEKTVHEIGKKHRVTVATSDGLEQMIILGEGAVRLSAPGLLEEVRRAEAALRTEHLRPSVGGKRFLGEEM